MRCLAERLGVSKAALAGIIDEGSQLTGQDRAEATTSPLHITFDFFPTSLENLEVKEKAVTSGKEALGSLRVRKEKANPEKEKVDCLEVTEEPVTLTRNEGGRRKGEENASLGEVLLEVKLKEMCLNDTSLPNLSAGKNDTKATEKRASALKKEELMLEKRLTKVSLNVTSPPFFVSKYYTEGTKTLALPKREEASVVTEGLTEGCNKEISPPFFSVKNYNFEATRPLSLQELTAAMMTLRQVVESATDMPRWFTFLFNDLLQSCYYENVDLDVQCERRGTASLPPRQDIVSALRVLHEALHNNYDMPAWCSFTLSRVLQRYRSRQRRRCTSKGLQVMDSQRCHSTSTLLWTWY